MQLSRKPEPHSLIDYFVLPNGKVDVFLRRNETIETEVDDEGNKTTVYVAEEIYFQTDPTTTKEYIEANFDKVWNDVENPAHEPTDKERLEAMESALLMIMMEG